MREIATHQVNAVNDELALFASDDPGPGGANHQYIIKLASWSAAKPGADPHMAFGVMLPFQNGAIKEAGVNGITHEVLIAIILDRLCSFQNGPYQCEENADAIKYLVLARAALGNRTANRSERGVEGTMKV